MQGFSLLELRCFKCVQCAHVYSIVNTVGRLVLGVLFLLCLVVVIQETVGVGFSIGNSRHSPRHPGTDLQPS